MNKNRLVIAIVVAVALSLAAAQAFALPQYYGWGTMSMMGGMNGIMNQGHSCDMMNGQGMMGSTMNGQSMNHQQCQQHMGSTGNQMLNTQYHEQCLQNMGPNHNMTPEQCQAMYQDCHS